MTDAAETESVIQVRFSPGDSAWHDLTLNAHAIEARRLAEELGLGWEWRTAEIPKRPPLRIPLEPLRPEEGPF